MSKQPDFSKQAAKKMLVRETILHPLTLYSGGVAILGLFGIALFGVSIVTGSVTAVALVVCVVSWLVNYFARGEVYLKRHLDSLHRVMEEQKQRLTQKLGNGLNQLKPVPGTEDLVKQAKAQFPMIEAKFSVFRELLSEKFAPSEITYGRYLGSAEQIYLSVLDQLNHVVTLFKSLESTDLNYTNERLKQLKKMGTSLSDDDRSELAAIEKRLQILDSGVKEIDVILSRNEEALTSLDLAKAAVAALQTSKGQASTGLPEAMRDLEDLAQRAKQYSIHSHS